MYYDEFGRIAQAGNVEIRYTNRRIVRVGGMRIFYNNFGYFSHYTGFVSPWYTAYVYRPWHVFYARPFYSRCIVYDFPYRRYYTPFRYGYAFHRKHFRRGYRYYRNSRRDFARVGSRIHHRNGRYSVNRDFRPNRENTAARYNKRKDRDGIATRPSNTINTVKGRPTNATRPSGGSTYKGRPTTTVNRGKPTNTRPSYDGTVSRGKPKVDRTKPSYNSSTKGRPSVTKTRPKVTKDYAKSRPKVNRGKPTYSKPKVTRSKPQMTKRSSNVKRSSNNTKMRSTTSTSRKGSSTKRSSRRSRL